MSAMLFLAVLPDLVLGSAVTLTEFLKAATGPIASLTTDTSSREMSSELCLSLSADSEDISHITKAEGQGSCGERQDTSEQIFCEVYLLMNWTPPAHFRVLTHETGRNVCHVSTTYE